MVFFFGFVCCKVLMFKKVCFWCVWYCLKSVKNACFSQFFGFFSGVAHCCSSGFGRFWCFCVSCVCFCLFLSCFCFCLVCFVLGFVVGCCCFVFLFVFFFLVVLFFFCFVFFGGFKGHVRWPEGATSLGPKPSLFYLFLFLCFCFFFGFFLFFVCFFWRV